MFLFFVWSVILISGIISQHKRLGHADISMWMVMASIGTLLVLVPLTFVSGMINQTTLVVVVVIIIVTGAIFMFTRGRNDPI